MTFSSINGTCYDSMVPMKPIQSGSCLKGLLTGLTVLLHLCKNKWAGVYGKLNASC